MEKKRSVVERYAFFDPKSSSRAALLDSQKNLTTLGRTYHEMVSDKRRRTDTPVRSADFDVGEFSYKAHPLELA